jgi:hypothetical protein
MGRRPTITYEILEEHMTETTDTTIVATIPGVGVAMVLGVLLGVAIGIGLAMGITGATRIITRR